MVIIFFRSAGAQLTLGTKHFCLKMYVHENVVRILGGINPFIPPRDYAPGDAMLAQY